MRKTLPFVLSITIFLCLLGVWGAQQPIKMETAPAKSDSVAGNLDDFIGNWTGKKNITDESGKLGAAYIEHLKIEPALGGKFLRIETLHPVKGFERFGMMSFDPASGNYLLYLFDSNGFSGKFSGVEKDNLIAFSNEDSPVSIQFYTDKDNQRFRIFKKGDISGMVYFSKDLPPAKGGGLPSFLPGGGMIDQNPAGQRQYPGY